MSLSIHEQILQKPRAEREAWVNSQPVPVLEELSKKPWWYIGRPEQQEPDGEWNIWLILSGRGWGKTRTGSEWITRQVIDNPFSPDGTPTQWAIVAPTFGDAKNICVEGPSGVLKALQNRGLTNGIDFIYNKSSHKILFNNGQVIHTFGADSPDAGRGLNLSGAWLDELAMWQYPYETWTEGLAPALRIGIRPRVVVTTTPKPIKLLRDWVKRTDGSIHITRGSTFDNSKNLSETALLELRARYEGTKTGRQELYGELLEDVDGALWTRAMIENHRLPKDAVLPPFTRIVVGIDPAVTSSDESDFTGIVTAGMSADGHYYILSDDTIKASPQEWATVAVNCYERYKADRIVAETNNGGDLVIHLLQQVKPNVATRKVTASRGKALRAEPIAALYEQGRVHHVGAFPRLEDEMCEWAQGVSEKSPDRLDAMVWALTDLSENSTAINFLSSLAVFCPSCRMPAPKSAKFCPSCNTAIGVTNVSSINTPNS